MEEQNASLDQLISEVERPLWRSAAEARLSELRAEVERLKAINEEISSVSDKWRGELNGAEQALAGALLQLSEAVALMQEVVWFNYHKGPGICTCEKCTDVRNFLTGHFAQKTLPVEGQPGDVCGPCGVAHPVAQKRKRDLFAMMKTHPLTCGECRTEIRTDLCPACAERMDS